MPRKGSLRTSQQASVTERGDPINLAAATAPNKVEKRRQSSNVARSPSASVAATTSVGQRMLRKSSLARYPKSPVSPGQHSARLFKALALPDTDTRDDTITQDDVSTFEWVFQSDTGVEKNADIHHWLQHGSRFFWLNGKSGSGKSTLMRFLVSSPRTMHSLATWAGCGRAMVVAFFFGSSGKPLQRSIRDLLRSCLHQILEHDPIAAKLLESLLAKTAGPAGPPDFDSIPAVQLRNMLLAILDTGATRSIYYCFFVDALGDCESGRADLLCLLTELAARPHVKVCASSCPWPEFTEHFRDSAAVTLQRPTSTDISAYVQHRLNNVTLLASDLKKLTSEIISRANGNSLWAALITHEAHIGLAKGEDLGTLLARVETTPHSAPNLIVTVVTRQIEEAHQHIMETFVSLCAAAKQPLDLLTFCLANLEEVQAAANPTQLRAITLSGTAARALHISATVSDRPAGLLEISRDENEIARPKDPELLALMNHDVDFAHESVADVVKDNTSSVVELLQWLLKASALVIIWGGLKQNYSSAVAHARSEGAHYALMIAELDPDEHAHKAFARVLCGALLGRRRLQMRTECASAP